MSSMSSMSSMMRNSVMGLVSALLMAPAAAWAQRPLDPYSNLREPSGDKAAPAPPPSSDQPGGGPASPQPGYYPPPQPGYYPPPHSGYYPSPPSGYYPPPPSYGGAPQYPYPYPPSAHPPSAYRPGPGCASGDCGDGRHRRERVRVFSIGGRASYLALNSQLGDRNVTLGGGGVELRFRNSGRFGLEASVDFLHGDFDVGGPLTRDSYPIQLSALFYVMPNRDANHFNLYLLAGLGAVPSRIGLVDYYGQTVHERYTEYEGHLGVGLELRFHFFALRADVRGLALWRDNGSGAGAYFAGVAGAPVPAREDGVLATAGAAFWF